ADSLAAIWFSKPQYGQRRTVDPGLYSSLAPHWAQGKRDSPAEFAGVSAEVRSIASDGPLAPCPDPLRLASDCFRYHLTPNHHNPAKPEASVRASAPTRIGLIGRRPSTWPVCPLTRHR